MINFLAACNGLGPVVTLLKNVVRLIQFFVPMLLIVFGILDLGKAVIASKEDEMKAAQKILIKRVIYALVIFLVVTIVTYLMGLVGSTDWKDCWKSVGKGHVSDSIEVD